jgi:hypothetical protein
MTKKATKNKNKKTKPDEQEVVINCFIKAVQSYMDVFGEESDMSYFSYMMLGMSVDGFKREGMCSHQTIGAIEEILEKAYADEDPDHGPEEVEDIEVDTGPNAIKH